MPHHQHKIMHGSRIMFLSSIVAFCIAIINFYHSNSPIRHTGGAELVIITSFIIACLCVLLYFFRHLPKRWERVSVYLILLLLIFGSLFAGYLLESWTFCALLLLTLIGWLTQIATR